jgi:hypothetical protein
LSGQRNPDPRLLVRKFGSIGDLSQARDLNDFRARVESDVFTGGGDQSVRRASGIQNVTMRENKRPKEREKE